MSTEHAIMQDTAREIILDCLVGALHAHNPHWSTLVDADGNSADPVVHAISEAIRQVARAYPEPSDPRTAQALADFFGVQP